MPPHLLVDISYHGFGHIAQTAPVVNELRKRIPALRATLRCAAPREILARRIEGDFDHVPEALDFGMAMTSAVDVLAAESAAAYADFHRGWESKVEREAGRLASLSPDLLLANVPYLSLAAAARAKIPAAAMCSLNWADIYRRYCGDVPGAGEIHATMLAAYNSARCFLKLGPGMEMPDLRASASIGPVARIGTSRREELTAKLRLGANDKLVLVALGGIPMRLPLESWPRIPGVRWLVPSQWQARHRDAIEIEPIGMHFTDLLRSCDALIVKAGYGSFVEAACNGVPVLYLRRPDWPEEPPLVEWLKHNARCIEIDRPRLERGDIAEALHALWTMAETLPPAPVGIREAADYLEKFLQLL